MKNDFYINNKKYYNKNAFKYENASWYYFNKFKYFALRRDLKLIYSSLKKKKNKYFRNWTWYRLFA